MTDGDGAGWNTRRSLFAIRSFFVLLRLFLRQECQESGSTGTRLRCRELIDWRLVVGGGGGLDRPSWSWQPWSRGAVSSNVPNVPPLPPGGGWWLEVAELNRLDRRLGSPMTRQFIIRLLMRSGLCEVGMCEVGKRSGRSRSSLGHTAGYPPPLPPARAKRNQPLFELLI